MGWHWWWMVVVAGMVTGGTRSAGEYTNAQDLEKEALSLLTPLLGDVDTALKTLIDGGKVGMGMNKFINMIVKQVFTSSPDDVNVGSSATVTDRKLLALFELLSRRLDQMEHGVHGIENSLRDVAKGMQDFVRWEIALNTMESFTRPINTLYTKFLLYQKIKDKVDDYTLMDFADTVVSHDLHSIMASMVHLHTMAAPEAAHQTNSPLLMHSQWSAVFSNPKDIYLVPERPMHQMTLEENLFGYTGRTHHKLSYKPSLFVMLHDALKSSDECQLHQSPQQLMSGLHLLLAITQARGYAMLEFAWMVLRVYNEGNFTAEHEVSESLYLQYSEDIMKEARKVLLSEPRDFFKCDPRKHQEGKTYIQLTELLQGYIENEVDMNWDGSCSQTCGYYQHAKSEGCYMHETQYCGKQRRCLGTIHDCQYYNADAWVCVSNKRYRRYDSLKYENGLLLGETQSCEGSTVKVDSWWRFLYHCSYCLCLCDDGDSPTTDRYISLTPALSDTQNNMVVTGIRFTKKNRVIHLQVQQGQALPQGQVNISTVHWVDVEPIDVFRFGYEEGSQYKKLSYEDRSIDLDRLIAPADHVVTGVRFRMLGSHINLEVQITPVNYISGELQPYKSYWISNDNTPAMSTTPRQEFKIHSPDAPTKFPGLSKQDSRPDMYLRFGPTDRSKDVAQLTVPFFDAQGVAPFPSTWFSGVELFHKGQHGSGGFLGLKVITYDMTPYMEVTHHAPMTLNLLR